MLMRVFRKYTFKQGLFKGIFRVKRFNEQYKIHCFNNIFTYINFHILSF